VSTYLKINIPQYWSIVKVATITPATVTDQMALSIDLFPMRTFLTRNENISEVKKKITELDNVPENPNMLVTKCLDRTSERSVSPISIMVGLSRLDFQIDISSFGLRLNVHVVIPTNVNIIKITPLLNSKKSDVIGIKNIGTRKSIKQMQY
jgi:hypothetical protein